MSSSGLGSWVPDPVASGGYLLDRQDANFAAVRDGETSAIGADGDLFDFGRPCGGEVPSHGRQAVLGISCTLSRPCRSQPSASNQVRASATGRTIASMPTTVMRSRNPWNHGAEV